LPPRYFRRALLIIACFRAFSFAIPFRALLFASEAPLSSSSPCCHFLLSFDIFMLSFADALRDDAAI